MKKYVIVDMDGTLTIVGDRLECLNNGRWDEFYARCLEDLPNEPVVQVVKYLHAAGYQIVFCTGRPDSVSNKTMDQIRVFTGIPTREYDLLMRKPGDYRKDTVVKKELVMNHCLLSDIFLVLEDRDAVVQMWRSLGLVCFQVRDGSY